MSKRTLIFPAASPEWEVWRGTRAQMMLERRVQDPALAAVEAPGIGLPASELLLFALWLNTRDATLFEGLIRSQLEKRGLVSRSGSAPVFDYQIVTEDEGRTLVRVSLLPVNFPPSLALSQAQFYAAAGDLLPLPEHRMILWMERRQLILAVTRGDEMVYQQVLGHGAVLTAAIVAEMGALRFALEAEGVMRKLVGITLWQSPEEPITGGECLAALGLPVEEAERPAPAVPRVERAASRARLLPAPVQAARRAKARKERWTRYAAIAGAVYVGFVFLLWAWQLQLKRKAAALGELVQADQPAAAMLERSAAAWRVLESAVDPRTYALEQFHQATAVLPAVGMRFTAFELKGDTITIRGTARNAPEIYKYVEALRKHREMPSYYWRVTPPRVLRDDTAEFRIEGRRQ